MPTEGTDEAPHIRFASLEDQNAAVSQGYGLRHSGVTPDFELIGCRGDAAIVGNKFTFLQDQSPSIPYPAEVDVACRIICAVLPHSSNTTDVYRLTWDVSRPAAFKSITFDHG